jgi:hypothetical protein
MEIKINILELASELAHQRVVADFNGQVYEMEIDGCICYTEEAQDEFNAYYDEYLTLIETTKVDNDGK